MKQLTRISSTFLLIFFLASFSCNQGGDQNQNDSTIESINQNNNNPTNTENWYVIKMTGQEVGKISRSMENLQFFSGGVEYQSKLKGDKRKYAVKSGDIILEVKYKDDAFKVRKPDGTLLWKIKLYDDKVKISNNEENLNPYEIKLSDTPDKAKVKKNEETLGEVKFKSTEKQIEFTAGTKSYYVESDKLYLAFGALLIEEIPENIRYVIASELLAKGK